MLDMASQWQILGLVLDLTLKMSLILAVAWVATMVLRRTAASVRHLSWNLAFCSLLGLPLLSFALPSLRADWLPSKWLASFWQPVGDSLPNAAATHSHGVINWPLAIVVCWLLGVVFFLGKAAVESLWMDYTWRQATIANDDEWLASSRQCANRLGMKRPVTLAFSGNMTVPATYGVFRPKVLLPLQAKEWSVERRHVVLLHEFAHIRRWDYAFNMICQLACALNWHNPLIWIAARHLRLERECAADDYVIDAGTASIEYAEHLYEIARDTHKHPGFGNAAVAMAHHCPLKARVASILDPSVSRAKTSTRRTLASLALAMLLLAPLAAMQPRLLVPGSLSTVSCSTTEITNPGHTNAECVKDREPVCAQDELLMDAGAARSTRGKRSYGSRYVDWQEGAM